MMTDEEEKTWKIGIYMMGGGILGLVLTFILSAINTHTGNSTFLEQYHVAVFVFLISLTSLWISLFVLDEKTDTKYNDNY